MFEMNSLVPELFCRDFKKSLNFYTEVLGFRIGQHRQGDEHCYLILENNQIMLVQEGDEWMTGPLEYPYGRGINFQCFVSDVETLYDKVTRFNHPIFIEKHKRWYWRPDHMEHRIQFGIQDPDGYFLRFVQALGTRPVTQADRQHPKESG